MRNHVVEHPAAYEETPALVAHILESYHETHRRALPDLLALARKVEAVHGTDPNAPHGLAEALQSLMGALEVHMTRAELVLFPAIERGEREAATGPMAIMRHDHDEQEQALARLAAITHGFRLPSGACSSWTRLYSGIRKLLDDLEEHIHLEKDVLFPRVETAG